MGDTSKRYVIGIDEAGRGPLAGPVAVGAVAVPVHFDFSVWGTIRDSKQLPEQRREQWYSLLKAARSAGVIRFSCAMSAADMIDRTGIVVAIRYAVKKAIQALEIAPHEAIVLLDGALHAPVEYETQHTIINGDAMEEVIALASIVAKVRRDRLMKKYALTYPAYGFDAHKGYGTKRHRELIAKHGLCAVHRSSFCKNT